MWAVTNCGERHGDKLGFNWNNCGASHEWSSPEYMDDRRSNVYKSDTTFSRTGQEYSHQRFTFTVARKKEHYLLSIFLPFSILTSSVGLCSGVNVMDVNTRLTILGSFFLSLLSLRYITGQYIPPISYSTRLDMYVSLCLLFVVAAMVGVVAVSRVTSPLEFDTLYWIVLGSLWVCTNIYFFQFFLGKYVASLKADKEKQEKREFRATATQNVSFGNDCGPGNDECQETPEGKKHFFRFQQEAFSYAFNQVFLEEKSGCFPLLFATFNAVFQGILFLVFLPLATLDGLLCWNSCGRLTTQYCKRRFCLTFLQYLFQCCLGPFKKACWVCCKSRTTLSKKLCVSQPLKDTKEDTKNGWSVSSESCNSGQAIVNFA